MQESQPSTVGFFSVSVGHNRAEQSKTKRAASRVIDLLRRPHIAGHDHWTAPKALDNSLPDAEARSNALGLMPPR